MDKLLVIGGSDAGISAALRARECDPTVAVTVVVADAFPNYSICGLPFYLSGEVADWHTLAHRTAEEIGRAGIDLLLDHTAQAIDPAGKTVAVVDAAGRARSVSYDRLVIATGAVPVRPPIAGLALPGVHLLHSMADSFRLQRYLAERDPRSAIIIGTGYIGLEMADALVRRGIGVTVLKRGAAVLSATVDATMARVVEDELRRHGVDLVGGVSVESIQVAGPRLEVCGSGGLRQSADLILVAVGTRPASELAAAAGVATGSHGAIRVDRRMATNLPDAYAAGDCVETWHRVIGENVYLPLGTTAHKQGRVAGENAVGGQREFAGSLGTQVVKVFELAIARTGMRDREAALAGFEPLTAESRAWDHKAYYPGAHEILLRITGDRRTGRLLGAQMVGHWQAQVAKRIDIFASALFHGMKVEELSDLDLSYTPPLGSPWDAIQIGAQAWSKQ
jgi:NADPH-dependent 2,4-dienoyl-CoA reductase/sulfur reductase-like enzyme